VPTCAPNLSPNPNPAVPAGAPEAGPTFFCEQQQEDTSSGGATMCYRYSTALLTFPQARSACQAMGGEVVAYRSAAKQLRVERYFAAAGTLTPFYYWLGMSRAGLGSPYTYLDGAQPPQLATNEPYAHWSWYHPKAANTSGYDCVLAYSSYRYSGFTGNDTAASQCDPAAYATAPDDMDRK
jgi:hypothetical protein